jgi:ATP-dependent helicase/nuclease subunit B
VELFRAASINDELREVLRRVAARGLRWDQVEIVAADASAYGSALHALSVRLGIPVTYAVGLPIERTRVGRVARGYLDWIEEGFHASPIRRLLEAGDLRPPRPHRNLAPAALARRFRALRIGWGRGRYRAQIRDALGGADRLEPRRFEPPESFRKRVTRTKDELEALRSILFPALKATPTVPDRMGEGGAPVSPAELATGLLAFLRRVPRGRGAERAARDEVTRVLERVRATLRRRTEFRAAVTILRRHLQIRVRAEVPGGAPDDPGAPWSSKGGHLHLSDLEHGGFSDRDAVFFVGLDADRFPGSGSQDPLLLDGDRRILSEALPTSSELLREQAFGFAALFARLRGPVTMSYAAWDAAEARSISPSPVLLQALRLGRGDASLTFRDLHEAVGRVVCAVPRGGGAALDGDDVWMAELGCGDVMRHGVEAVRAAFPRLDAGLAAKLERENGLPGPVHGVVRPRPNELDPRRNSSIVVSPSRLEALGACPLKYLHESVLGVRAPDDPELDPDCWLNAMQRGSLLHGVYEAALRAARERDIAEGDAAFEALALDLLRVRVDAARDEVPVPGEGTWRRERVALEEDVRSFVRMVREIGAPWIRLEFGFGLAGGDPVPLDLGEGRVLLRGVVDRVDDRGIEGIRVVDYKTGSSGWFADGGTFNGGRRLQAALYAHAVEAELGGAVAAGEYHFPTRRGENEVLRYDRLSLAGVGEVVGHLLDGVAQGAFVPTDRPDDCKFCDYAAVCRVRTLEWGKVSAPLAEWSQQHVNAGVLAVFGPLQRARTYED